MPHGSNIEEGSQRCGIMPHDFTVREFPPPYGNVFQRDFATDTSTPTPPPPPPPHKTNHMTYSDNRSINAAVSLNSNRRQKRSADLSPAFDVVPPQYRSQNDLSKQANSPSPGAYTSFCHDNASNPRNNGSPWHFRPTSTEGLFYPDEIDDFDHDTFKVDRSQPNGNGVPTTHNKTLSRKRFSLLERFTGPIQAPTHPSRDHSGSYGPLKTGYSRDEKEAVSADAYIIAEEKQMRRRRRWLFLTLAALIVVAIIAAVLIGIRSSKTAQNKSSASSSEQTTSDKAFLDKTAPEIQKLFNNPGLHKVFPGVDYTPQNAQYPDCLSTPADQNNITKDVALLSQLTNNIRLYGTDCNQTEMVLEAIDRLGLTNVKVWMGVWLDSNQTTNDRGIQTMYKILKTRGTKPFAGVIIGNEVLFRKDLSTSQMSQMLAEIKSNFTGLQWDLPIATSDLGDDWTADLAQQVDIIMSNIHPFFAGVSSVDAASWTWDFWQTHDIPLSSNANKKNIISEVGWPSSGGTDCGDATSCSQGSVAGINEMNTFMENFVCQSLVNKTDFFWFEAFDEAWKVKFNVPGREWEDKWGLMDADRNLKPGVKIPDCSGRTAS